MENTGIDERKLIEENRRLRQELKQRTFELSIIYDLSNSISYTLDYDGFLHLIMESLNKIIDYDLCTSLIVLEEEHKAKMVIRVAHPISKDIVEEVKRNVLTALGGLRGEALFEKDILLEFKGEIIIVVFLRDVTREREVEHMKSDFVSIVSHELPTPLAAMTGAVE